MKNLSHNIEINKSIIAQCSGIEMSIVTTGQLAIIGWGWVWSDWGGCYPMNNNLQDLHNSSHHTKDESNNCFNYPFKTICTLKHACLDWVPSQFVCSSANSGYKRKFSSSCHPLTCIFTVLPVFRQKFGCFLFTKGVKFSAIFSSSTKIAELTQPRPQWSLSCRPFSRR